MLAAAGLCAMWCPGPGGGLLPGEARAQAAAERIFDLKIEGGQVAKNARLMRVRQGETVRLRLTTDKKMVLHLHGYDIEKTAVPGAVTEFRFEAYAAGRFSLEIHGQGGAHNHAPLVTLEVYPR